ncbi:maleylacetate reductase [Mesorhizobium sp. SB112]|uniref:maleylacetate reductase n=1 Tax=Mesorhizobium sp. SB112 TaxID=3151853 RepID=UPI003264107D
MSANFTNSSLSFELPGGVYNVTPPRIVFGAGTRQRVADEVARLGGKRAVVLSTPGRHRMAQDVADNLGAACVGLLPQAVSQVPIELARQGRVKVRELEGDCLVSVGGGASIGLGKGISLELGIPIVAIPTTYSGSEMTGFCGITIDGVKRMHSSLNMLASTVIYDPELSMGLPLGVSAASAFNALAHCVDAIYVATASPVTQGAAAEGAGAVVEGLRRVIASPRDLGARSQLLYGAYLSGAALTGGFALQHGVAHTLGGSFGIEHGTAHALVLPYVAAFNAVHAPKLGRIAEVLKTDNIGATFFDLLNESGLPTSLKAIGFDRRALDDAARITAETDNGLNPVPVTKEVARAILENAYEGHRPS